MIETKTLTMQLPMNFWNEVKTESDRLRLNPATLGKIALAEYLETKKK